VPERAALAAIPQVVDQAACRRSSIGDIASIVQLRGLQLPPRLSYGRWLAIGTQLASVTTSTAWCLGDWLAYGETAFTGRYREAIEQTSLDYQTLRNYAWVAKRFPMSRRRDTLSFSHHAEVAALTGPEQDFWLRKAEELSWSRNELRREVKGSLHERKISTDASREAPPRLPVEAYGAPDQIPGQGWSATVGDAGSTVKVCIPAEQIEIYQKAADACGLCVEEWALQILEGAARYALTIL
jgi:hypothetical protein